MNSLAYCLNQERQRATDYRPGMTPEDIRGVSNRTADIPDIGIAHTVAALPHERPVTNSLAYCLNQERQRATDYRPGMTPEDVRRVSNRMADIRHIGTREAKRATDYRPGMTPEDIRVVSKQAA
jgi:hypothetical protein